MEQVVKAPSAPLQARALNEYEAANYVDLSVQTLRLGRMGIAKCGTPPFCRNGRRIIYLRDDVDRWLETLRVQQEPKA
jgi:hypothetical protein